MSNSEMETISIRVPADLLEQIDIIATETERSRNFLIVRALRTFMMNEGKDLMNHIIGKEQLARGERCTADEVIELMERIIAGQPDDESDKFYRE